MAEVVAQRPDLRRFVRLMYPAGSAASASTSALSSAGSGGGGGSAGGGSAGAGANKQPALSKAQKGKEEEGAIAEWRAAAARPVAQEGHSWGAAAALAAAVVQARC